MTFSSEYLKVNIYGSSTAADIWNTGFFVRTTLTSGSWTYDNLAALAESVHSIVNTWWTTMKANNDSQISWSGHKLYAYPSSGGNAYLVYDRPETTPVAGTSSVHLPMFTSAVQSLRSLHAGRSGRGRMYMPANGVTLTAGQFTSGIASTMATTTAAMLSSINAADWSAYNVSSHKCCVVSRTSAGVATDAFYDISSIQVDTKPDTQHRRDNRIKATATSSAGVT